jgi:hypothetical protein
MVASTTERASFMGSDGFLAGNFFFGACFMVAFRLGCNMTHHAIASSLSPTHGQMTDIGVRGVTGLSVSATRTVGHPSDG